MPRRGRWPIYAGYEDGIFRFIPSRNFSEPTRQSRKRERMVNEFAAIRREFGGTTDRGGYHYAEGMTRRIARQIARDKASA